MPPCTGGIQPWVQHGTSGQAALIPFLDPGRPALGTFLDQGLSALGTTRYFRAGSPGYIYVPRAASPTYIFGPRAVSPEYIFGPMAISPQYKTVFRAGSPGYIFKFAFMGKFLQLYRFASRNYTDLSHSTTSTSTIPLDQPTFLDDLNLNPQPC